MEWVFGLKFRLGIPKTAAQKKRPEGRFFNLGY